MMQPCPYIAVIALQWQIQRQPGPANQAHRQVCNLHRVISYQVFACSKLAVGDTLRIPQELLGKPEEDRLALQEQQFHLGHFLLDMGHAGDRFVERVGAPATSKAYSFVTRALCNTEIHCCDVKAPRPQACLRCWSEVEQAISQYLRGQPYIVQDQIVTGA